MFSAPRMSRLKAAAHKEYLGDRLDSLQFIALLGFIARLAEQIYEQAKGSWVTLR
jgi:hypothetical protein